VTDDVAVWIDKLNSLGRAEDVRDLLVAEGVTGRRYAAYRCPLSVLLHQHCSGGEYRSFGVVRTYVTAFRSGSWTDYPLSGGASEFVDRFDHGDFVELCDLETR
jgi:hypothetical protein